VHPYPRPNYNITNEQASRDDAYRRFNDGQKRCFDEIVNAIEAIVRGEPHEAYFFLQGYAGIGKIFLYTAICQHFRAQEKIVLCVTSSGIAALLFPSGTTLYSRFKIPV